jgi:LacI family transcriptional regulator
LRAGGLALMVSSSEEDADVEKQEIRALQNRGVDVLLIASCQPMRSKDVFVGERKTPFVLIDRNFPKMKVNFVGSDDIKAGEVATRHLILLGRRRIAHIGGEGLSPSVGRLAGYRNALAAAKLRMPEHYVVTRGLIEESGDSAGYQAMQELLGRRPLPDAVFCYNDLAAIGAMKAVMESGLRVPQDIAFVGCGNLRYAEYLKVPLSSIDQGTERMGFAAAKLALALAATKLPPRPETFLMEPTLVVRRSSMAE